MHAECSGFCLNTPFYILVYGIVDDIFNAGKISGVKNLCVQTTFLAYYLAISGFKYYTALLTQLIAPNLILYGFF